MSKGNMYEWVTDTWNPLAGECPHKCPYCSTHKLAQRWEAVKKKYSGSIRIDDSIYKNLKGKEKTIFVVGQNDLFANEVPNHIIYSILERCMCWNQHTYLFQSKNPARFFDFLHIMPEKSIICTTIETNRFNRAIMGNAPSPFERAKAMSQIHVFRKYITIEPIMDFDLEYMIELIKMCEPEQVNIGADSGRNNLPEPSKEKIIALIEELKKFTTIARKTNLERLLK